MKHKIIQRLLVANEIIQPQTKLSDAAIKIMATDLERYGQDALIAINETMRTEKYKLTLAAIRENLPDRTGWYTAEEAWQKVPRSEYDGGYVCTEMLVALEQSRYGDDKYARSGFIEAWNRLKKQAISEGRKMALFWSGPVGVTQHEHEQMKLSAGEEKKEAISHDGVKKIHTLIDQVLANEK